MTEEEQAKRQAILLRAKSVASIKPLDATNREVFKTGTGFIDNACEIYFGTLAVVSGMNGCGKSTWLGQLMIESLHQGYNVFAYSGELKENDFQHWIDRQAAGSNGVEQHHRKDTGKTFYTIKENVLRDIHNWYDNRFWLYDNDSSMKYSDIINTIEVFRQKHNTRIIFIDNFLTLDVSDLDNSELKAQTEFINHLARYCKKKDVIVFMVIHPKKIGRYAVTKSDVLGSGNLTNAIDYLFIVHRVNEMFRISLKERPLTKDTKEMFEKADNIIEIAKDRHGSSEGLNALMEYKDDSKRLVEYGYDNPFDKVYRWVKTNESPF
jgi:archaellum biogenesis ATPase FlaH